MLTETTETKPSPTECDNCCSTRRPLMTFAWSLLCDRCVRDTKQHGGFDADSDEQVVE